MALPGTAQPTPHMIGAAFVQQYYYVLHQSPAQVHKFYQDSSILSRPDSNGLMTPVTTIQAINDKLLSLDFNNYTAEIESADSQASYKDGVLVVVTGSLTGRDCIRRKFIQSFFLAPQEKGGYVVLNDVFRFVDLTQSREVNQVIVNGTNGDASTADIIPEHDPSFVQEPHVGASTEHDTLHSAEDIDNDVEIVETMENVSSEESILVAADTEVHTGQSDGQAVFDVAVSMSPEDEPKKSYASIVKVYKVTQSSVPNSIPISKTKTTLTKVTPKFDAVEKQHSIPSKPSMTFEAAVTSGENMSENNSNDVEGHSIYIRNLPLSTTPEEVEAEFKRFGPIKPGGVQVRNHKVDRFCYGFVEFESMESMQAAIKASSIAIGGRQVSIEEKRTTTRVINGVVTNGGLGNGGGSSMGRGRYLPSRSTFRNDNFRGRGGYSGGNFRPRNEYSGRGRGGLGRSVGTYQQRSFQNGNGRMFRPAVANQTAVSA